MVRGAQGLHHEVRDDAAIVGLEARAVGVEDADEVGVDAVVAVPGGDGGLGEALGLVVDGARADGVDAAPVGLDLGMNLGVAVALGGGGVEVAGAVLAREVEGVDGSRGADEEGFGAEAVVVDGAAWRGEVEDEVDRAGIEGGADVLLKEGEAGLAGEVGEVGQVAGCEVVYAEHRVALREERIGQVRAEEPCGSGDEDLLGDHVFRFRLLQLGTCGSCNLDIARGIDRRATDADVSEAEFVHHAGVEEIAAIDDDGVAHDGVKALEIERGKLRPVGEDEQSVGVDGSGVGVGDVVPVRCASWRRDRTQRWSSLRRAASRPGRRRAIHGCRPSHP